MEYLAEAACLGLFMVSAAAFATLLAPRVAVSTLTSSGAAGSRAHGHRDGRHGRGTDYSPWGRRLRHMNPAVALAFWRLGKIASADAAFSSPRSSSVVQVSRWPRGYCAAPGTARSTTSRRRARRASASPSPLRRHLVRDDARGPYRLEPRARAAVHGHLCRNPRVRLHRHRGAAVGHEHESARSLGRR